MFLSCSYCWCSKKYTMLRRRVLLPQFSIKRPFKPHWIKFEGLRLFGKLTCIYPTCSCQEPFMLSLKLFLSCSYFWANLSLKDIKQMAHNLFSFLIRKKNRNLYCNWPNTLQIAESNFAKKKCGWKIGKIRSHSKLVNW